MDKTKAEIEQIILDFLQEHGEDYFTCALATCSDNQPRNTPVDARNDGLNMYFVADGGGKIENIRKNPKVCLAVFMPVGRGYMKNARGLQMWGRAQIITLADKPEEFEKGFNTIRLHEISQASFDRPFPDEMKPEITIVKIVPRKIAYFATTGATPGKYVWEAEE